LAQICQHIIILTHTSSLFSSSSSSSSSSFFFFQQLNKVNGDNPLVGCEWWCHSRPITNSSLGHQLHFDTDELALEQLGEVHCPAYGSVCYLAGGRNGAPTLVLDQPASTHDSCRGASSSSSSSSSASSSSSTTSAFTNGEGKNKNKNKKMKMKETLNVLEEKNTCDVASSSHSDASDDATSKLAKRGWLAHPRNRSFLLFEGNLLHGVLPDITSSSSSSSSSKNGHEDTDDNRLTLMIGWWTRDPTTKTSKAVCSGNNIDNDKNDNNVVPKVKKVRRRRYGPCCPVPPASRTATWVSDLQSFRPSSNQTQASNNRNENVPRNHNNHSKKRSHSQQQDLPIPVSVQTLSPVWETISTTTTTTTTTSSTRTSEDNMPSALDGRFFLNDLKSLNPVSKLC
jgi:hypothetical protein